MNKEQLETSVTKASRALDSLERALSRNGVNRIQAEKAFAFLQGRFNAIQHRVLVAATDPGTAFSLDMELPAPLNPVRAALPVQSLPISAPAARAATPHAGPAPTPSGLTVDMIGGRLVRDVRDAGPPRPQTVDDIDFIDDDETDTTPNPTADDGVDFEDD